MSLSIKTTKVDNDHLYIDCNLINNTNSSANPRYIPCRITQVRDKNILDNIGEFNVTIVRFSVSSNAIPRITQGNTVPEKIATGTYFWVTIFYNGNFYPQEVIIPQIINREGLPSNSVYNVQEFVNLINDALLNAQIASGIPGLGANVQPFLKYIPETELFEFLIPADYFNVLNAEIYFSLDLFLRVGSFPCEQAHPLNTAPLREVKIVQQWTGDNYLPNQVYYFGNGAYPPAGADYMLIKQDKAFAASIESVTRVVLTTSMMPIQSELKSNQFSTQEGAGNNNQIDTILTDFLAGSDGQLINRNENYIYVPAFLRLTPLNGTSSLKSWDIIVNTANINGELVPLYIPPSTSVSFKLLFLRKGLTN